MTRVRALLSPGFLCSGLFGWGCAGEPAEAPAEVQPRRPHVVWISLDTTRADALGAWAAESHWGLDLPEADRPRAITPVLDRLAAEGVRFSMALAAAPTTLSSHTSAFSGRDAHGHRVVRNGYPVPDDIPLLPDTLAQAGWDVRGVVGSTVLESNMGLARGFSSFLSPEAIPGGNATLYTWDAQSVTNRALEQVAAHSSEAGPLFLFAHYYDPHMPWTDAPPAIVEGMSVPGYTGPIDGTMESIEALGRAARSGTLDPLERRQARARYLAEVAAVDVQLGRLFNGLQKHGILEHAIVVVMADHGETLEELPLTPYSHGPNVALVDIHVPLILTGFGDVGLPAGVVVDQPVGLIDLPATVYGLLHLDGDPGQGVDLAPSWSGQRLPERVLFAEATKPIRYEHQTLWNNLPMERSGIGSGPSHPLQLLVQPLLGGARELRAVVPGAPLVKGPDSSTRAAAKTLLDGLTDWDRRAPPHRDATYDDATRRALIELGYLDPDEPSSGGADGAGTTSSP
jgi:arylsulfatase A-like enzyme